MADRPDWAREGRNWPHREASRFVSAGGLQWHVQSFGEDRPSGETMLLLHGTGAASHSFRDLAPLLARDHRVIVPDLPGHGFTGMPRGDGLSLPGMARLTGALMTGLGVDPKIVVGHSAGAAVGIAMTLLGLIRPRLIIGLNGALLPMRGTTLFSPLAKLLFLNPLVPRLFSWSAEGHGATRRLIEGTGSTIDQRGMALYETLFRNPGHVAGTLGMMANWDLSWLNRRLPNLTTPLLLIASQTDRAVPASDADAIQRKTPGARIIIRPTGGHLMHESDPAGIAALIETAIAKHPEAWPQAGNEAA